MLQRETITTCPKCESTNIKDVKIPEGAVIVPIQAKCEDCKEEFVYQGLSKSGRWQRKHGMII